MWHGKVVPGRGGKEGKHQRIGFFMPVLPSHPPPGDIMVELPGESVDLGVGRTESACVCARAAQMCACENACGALAVVCVRGAWRDARRQKKARSACGV